MTVTTPLLSRLSAGLLGGLLFFAVVLLGCGYIIFSKISGLSPTLVTAVPVCIMVAYAVVLGVARLFRLRDDQSGDNLYYMGFLFTLTSLAVSLYQFSADGSSEQIVQNFGIAIASTIAGIALRIFFNQMRTDPAEVEATARLELAEAARRVKREMESTVLEFSYFRRATQQSIDDAVEEAKEILEQAGKKLANEMREFAAVASKPLEEASQRYASNIDVASKQLIQVSTEVSKSATAMATATNAVVTKLQSLQSPDQVIEIKLSPMIQGLTRAVNAFSKGADRQTESAERSLRQTQDIVNTLQAVLSELQASAAENDRNR